MKVLLHLASHEIHQEAVSPVTITGALVLAEGADGLEADGGVGGDGAGVVGGWVDGEVMVAAIFDQPADAGA